MPEKLWKRTERAVARRLGGKRCPASGRAGADVEHPLLSVEVKLREKLPRWLVEALRQAESSAGDRLPAAVLHRPGDRYADALVIIRLSTLERLLS